MGFSINIDPGQIIGAIGGAVAAAAGSTVLGVAGGEITLVVMVGAYLGAKASSGSTQWNDWLSRYGTSVEQLMNALGIVGSQFELDFFTQAVAGNFDGKKLWTALGRDYANYQRAVTNAGYAEEILGGNYTHAWNLASDYGDRALELAKEYSAPGASPPRPPRDPKWNGRPVYLAALAGKADAQDSAAQLFAHGWYPEGTAVEEKFRQSLYETPVGALVAATAAIGSGDVKRMARLAALLDNASLNPTVATVWRTHDWAGGHPATTLGPIAQGLRDHIQQAERAKAPKKKTMPIITLQAGSPLAKTAASIALAVTPANTPAAARLRAAAGMAPAVNDELLVATPAPPAKPQSFWSKPLIGSVTPAEVGIGGAVLGLLYKVLA